MIIIRNVDQTDTPFGASKSMNYKINFSEHLLNVNKLLGKFVLRYPNELVHLLAGLLHPDPDYRLTPLDSLNHPFISSGISVPMSMIGRERNSACVKAGA